MLELISCFHITTIVSFIVYDNWQTDRGRSFFSFKTAMTATRSANSVRKHINGYARRRIDTRNQQSPQTGSKPSSPHNQKSRSWHNCRHRSYCSCLGGKCKRLPSLLIVAGDWIIAWIHGEWNKNSRHGGIDAYPGYLFVEWSTLEAIGFARARPVVIATTRIQLECLLHELLGNGNLNTRFYITK